MSRKLDVLVLLRSVQQSLCDKWGDKNIWSGNLSVFVGFLYIVVLSLLLSRLTRQSRKGNLPFSLISLVNCL